MVLSELEDTSSNGGNVLNDYSKNSEHAPEIRELILATNRTTHAVRAFVAFLFIQLAAITLALAVNFLGQSLQDQSQCSFGICPPNETATFIAGLIWIVGVVWSSNVGWKELGLSKIPVEGVSAPPRDPLRSEVVTGDLTTSPSEPVSADASSSEGESDVAESETKRCPKCGYSIAKAARVCRHCGS